jgi:hypothetical protein
MVIFFFIVILVFFFKKIEWIDGYKVSTGVVGLVLPLVQVKLKTIYYE